jgi:hypothetical protein
VKGGGGEERGCYAIFVAIVRLSNNFKKKITDLLFDLRQIYFRNAPPPPVTGE